MSQPSPQVTTVDDLPASASAAKERGWLAAVMPVILIAACAELGISVLNNSALPIYFTSGLGLGTRLLGFLMIPFFISEVLFKSPLGILADRLGRKPLMLGGALVTVFTPILLISMHYDPLSATAVATLIGFGFLRALDGLGQAAMWPSLYAYVGDVVAEKKRGAAMGVLNLVYMVGLAFSFLAGGFVDDFFGPLLTHDRGVTFRGQMNKAIHQAGHGLKQRLHRPPHSAALEHHGLAHPAATLPHGSAAIAPVHILPTHQPEYYQPSFYLASVLFAIAVIAALALRSRVPARANAAAPDVEAGAEESITLAGFVAALRTVPQFLGIAFVMFAGIGCISLLVKKFALDEFHSTETAFGVLVLGPALLIGLFAVPAGYLADKWGKTRCVRLGFLLAALGLTGIPLLYFSQVGQAGFMASAGVMGAGSVLAFPAWLALLTSLSDERQRGTIFAAVSTAQGVGILVGALLGTHLYDHSHIAPFIAAAALVCLATLLSLIFVREGALRRTAAV